MNIDLFNITSMHNYNNNITFDTALSENNSTIRLVAVYRPSVKRY